MTVSIKGLDRADVLAGLYNNSKPQGLGFLHFVPADMTKEQATDLLSQGTYFDYLQGRVMKVDLSSDESFDPWLYDRDNGQGTAQRVVDEIRANVE